MVKIDKFQKSRYKLVEDALKSNQVPFWKDYYRKMCGRKRVKVAKDTIYPNRYEIHVSKKCKVKRPQSLEHAYKILKREGFI